MEVTTSANIPFPAGNGTADPTLNKVSAGVHGAVDKMAVAADDAVRNVKPAIDRAAQIAHRAVNKVADVAGPTADWLSEQDDSLKATQRKVAADAGQYFSAHPRRQDSKVARRYIARLICPEFSRTSFALDQASAPPDYPSLGHYVPCLDHFRVARHLAAQVRPEFFRRAANDLSTVLRDGIAHLRGLQRLQRQRVQLRDDIL